MMRKTVLLAALAAGVFGVVAVAYAANTYSVSVAKVTPTKTGSVSHPKRSRIAFGYQVRSTDGNRPNVTTDYVISFGRGVKQNAALFRLATSRVGPRAATNTKLTCSIDKAGYVSGQPPSCPSTAKVGTGAVENIAGLTADPTNKTACHLDLTIYVGDGRTVPAANNDGSIVKNDLVLALKGAPDNPIAAKRCPIGVDGAIPAQFVQVGGGAALKFHVTRKPFQEPQTGVSNSVVSVTSTVAGNVNVKVGSRFVTRGLFETTSCPTGGRKVNVKFTDSSGATFNAFKVAPCQK
jgi:hypothetical protein